jgi:hypothetical protein
MFSDIPTITRMGVRISGSRTPCVHHGRPLHGIVGVRRHQRCIGGLVHDGGPARRQRLGDSRPILPQQVEEFRRQPRRARNPHPAVWIEGGGRAGLGDAVEQRAAGQSTTSSGPVPSIGLPAFPAFQRSRPLFFCVCAER